MAQTFLLLYAITNEKTVKLTQIDRIPAVPITVVGIPYLSLIYLDHDKCELRALKVAAVLCYITKNVH